VIRHWIPFDEDDLYARLHMRAFDVFRWLDDHDHTIAALARRRGADPDELERRLAGGRGRLVRARTHRVFTQSHLARHLLFHVFHNRLIGRNAPRICGVVRREWWLMRRTGATPFEVARVGGRSRAHATRTLWRFLVREQRVGVGRGLTTRREAARLLARQRRQMPNWLRRNRLGALGLMRAGALVVTAQR
jgi:hypothetical protein